MKSLIACLLLSSTVLSVTHDDVMGLAIPSLDRILLGVEKRHRAASVVDVFQVLQASASVAPRYTFTNFDRDPSAPYITFNIGLDLGRLIKIPNDRFEALQEGKGRVTKIYGEITKGIESGRKILLRMDTYEDLRTNTTDFEKRMLYSDKTYELEKELVGLYERLISLELDMYRLSGMWVGMEDAVFDYTINTLRKIFREEAGKGASYLFRPLRYRQ